MSPRRPPRVAAPHAPRRGFTVVEMLATMSVLAVTLAIAVPSMSGFIRGGKVRSAQSELVASLMLARSEAARRGVPVTLRAKGTAAAGGLARGWQVWVDSDGDGVVDANETRLRDVPDLGAGVAVTPATTLGAVYSPRGFLVPLSGLCLDIYSDAPGRKGSYRVRIEPAGLTDIREEEKCP